MIWSTFVSKALAAQLSVSDNSAKLFAKSNELSVEQRLTFLNICMNYLELFLKVCQHCENTEAIERRQSINHWSNNASTNLINLALSQPQPNYEVIHLHFQLTMCAYLVQYFRIRKPKIVKCGNLFDTQVDSNVLPVEKDKAITLVKLKNHYLFHCF